MLSIRRDQFFLFPHECVVDLLGLFPSLCGMYCAGDKKFCWSLLQILISRIVKINSKPSTMGDPYTSTANGMFDVCFPFTLLSCRSVYFQSWHKSPLYRALIHSFCAVILKVERFTFKETVGCNCCLNTNTRVGHMKTLNIFYLVIYWTHKVHSDIFLRSLQCVPYKCSSASEAHGYF